MGVTELASRAEAVGSLEVALAHAERLAESAPATALEQVAAILAAVPGHPHALLLRGRALLATGRAADARTVLAALSSSQPRSAATFHALARAQARTGDTAAAVDALRRAVALKPDLIEAWHELSQALRLRGDDTAADAAHLAAIRASARDPELVEAALALVDERLAEAETRLRARLERRPEDVAAIRMFAEVAARLGRYGDAETLLRRALELAPGFDAARETLARVLQRQNRPADALAEVDRLMARDASNPSHAMLRAAILVRLGDYASAIALYERVLATHPNQPKGWMSLGHALKTVGRFDDSVAAYRTAIAQAPALGEAWWSLANLKTHGFTETDVAAMEAALAVPELGDDDRLHLHFALGKAREDRTDHAAAFAHYARGNAVRRTQLPYRTEDTRDQRVRATALFTPTFLAARAGQGCPAPDPIFIVGLPRSGSTLIEQILSSHSRVEGTMELPDLLAIARRLGEARTRSAASAYPEVLATLDADRLAALGQEYIDRTRVQRRTARPFFIDKMPNNWAHVGLIRLILPNAKIIDARRHPLGCCLSAYKQHFARGQGFAYDLGELGDYYRDYVALMAHFDRVAPGSVHRVVYERMVADTEVEVRALLAHLGLDFEPACLSFHLNDRAVRTPSSEQVRRPIFTEGVDQWRHFEPWLGPLKAALGPVLDAYPNAPTAEGTTA